MAKAPTAGKTPAYNKASVDKAIKADPRIKGKEAKAIHRLLKGHQKTDESVGGPMDIVNFSMFAGMYSDGAHAVFTGRDSKTHKLQATGGRPRQYYIDGVETDWDDVKRQVGNQKIKPWQGMEMNEDGASDAERNPSIERDKYRNRHPGPSAADREKSQIDRDRKAGMNMDPMDINKRRKERAMWGESRKLNEGVLDDVDDDGFMAKRQLYDIAKYAVALHRMIQDTDSLEPWIQAKITTAADYIDTVKHYLEYNNVRDAEGTADVMGPPEMADIDDVGATLDTMIPKEEVMEFGDEDEGTELAGADILRMMTQRGIISPQQAMNPSHELDQAADSFAFDLGPVYEIGSSDVSIWMREFIAQYGAYVTLDGPKAHLYESEIKAASIYKNMLRELRGKK